MGKILDRFPFTDVLGVLAPGLVVLIAFRVAFNVDLAGIFGSALAGNDLVVTAGLLTLAYGIGILVFEWANAGTREFVQLDLSEATRRATAVTSWVRVRGTVRLILVGVVHWMPLPRNRDSFVTAQMMMSEFIERETGVFELSRISSPWDRLGLFQTLIARAELQGGNAVLEAAAQVHARLMYALCMSLVLTAVALGVLLRSVVFFLLTCPLDRWIMVTVPAGLTSYYLRRIAARCWENEMALVCSLGPRADRE